MKTITTENFESEVLRAAGPVLVEFWAPWCVYCRRLEPALEQVDRAYDHVTVGRVNIDDAPALADRCGVEVVPTLLLFRSGVPGEKLVAPDSKAKIEALLAGGGNGSGL